MERFRIGIDIGGTKTAVVIGDSKPTVYGKVLFPTFPSSGPMEVLDRASEAAEELIEKSGFAGIESIGVVCGGPLDSSSGLILSPPNLPGWDNIPVVEIFRRRFGVPVFLENDANACAAAEWMWGVGRGSDNMVFLTFGTGMGAGMILGGRLYRGTNGMAGEAGHIRLSGSGPEGYGKKGSFEGFCSGGGISRLAAFIISEYSESGRTTPFCELHSSGNVTAKDVCRAADNGDAAAVEILSVSGKYLGRGLSVLIDILNPDTIVIGSIFPRCGKHLISAMEKELRIEALGISASVCRIVPSGLGESLGDFAGICAADPLKKW